MHNMVKKIFKVKNKIKMINQVDNYTPALSPTHNLKCTQVESEGQLERM